MKLGKNFKKILGFAVLAYACYAFLVVKMFSKPNDVTQGSVMFSKPNDVTQGSVMITNIAGTSGGTGIVLSSSSTNSTILTNSHVCHVIENGGKVTGQSGTFLVATYKHAKSHDLCLITVDGDLKASTKVSNSAPVPFYGKATISGHPRLMPNVVTTGHFSGRAIIAVMKDMSACTEEQKQDPSTALICLLVGGIPSVVQYDSTLVTATIMAGSSGSGVYNENMELTGVVFAGSGDLSYAWTVPYESMKNFLDLESLGLPAQRPNNQLQIEAEPGEKSKEQSSMFEKLKEVCSTDKKVKIKNFCQLIDDTMLYLK